MMQLLQEQQAQLVVDRIQKDSAAGGAEATTGLGSSKQPDDSPYNAARHGICPEAASAATAPARPPSAEKPSTPDSAEVLPSAPTRPVRKSPDLVAAFGAMSLSTDPGGLGDQSGLTGFGAASGHAALPRVPSGTIRPTEAALHRTGHGDTKAAVAVPAATSIDSDHDDQDGDCTVCWSAAACMIFLPCGHLCCCEACAQPIITAGALCPMCRGPVVASISM